MKTTLLAMMLTAMSAVAQSNAPVNTFIKGTMNIKFETRVPDNAGAKPKPGTVDTYDMNLVMSDSVAIKGQVFSTPVIQGSMFGVNQQASLRYNLKFDIINPVNPSQRKPDVGLLAGVVPITPEGLYDYSNGGLKLTVYATGKAEELISPFGGKAQGRPLIKSKGGILDTIKKEAMSLKKVVNGKTVAVVVKKYDTMEFQSHVLPAGPVGTYTQCKVDGKMIYDYERYVWYFKDVVIDPATGSNMRLSGNIRWHEGQKQGGTRDGHYEFDVRVNEPEATEDDSFSAPTDESAFFQVDTKVPSLTGTMKYRDSIPGESVMSSEVAINLVGNQLDRRQCMALTKLLFFTCIVPMNAE